MTRRKKKKEAVVYFGPTIPGALKQFSVFIDKLPAESQRVVDQHSILKNLFIPVSQLAKARDNLKVQGSKEHSLYMKANKIVGGKN